MQVCIIVAQRCLDVVSTSGTEVASTLCKVETLTSDFVSFSTSDQSYFNVHPQRWNNVDRGWTVGWGNIRILRADKRRSYLLSEPQYRTKWFLENLLAIKMNKTKVKLNKTIYLGLSILYISKTGIYEFWNDYIKQKYKGQI